MRRPTQLIDPSKNPQTLTSTTSFTETTSISATTTLPTVTWTPYLANDTSLPSLANPYIRMNNSFASTNSFGDNKTSGLQFDTPANGGPFPIRRMRVKLWRAGS